MWAAAGSWPAPALVDGHIAIVDPLLVHPLFAEALFSGQRPLVGGQGGLRVWFGLVRQSVLRKDPGCQAHREKETDQPSVNRFHRLSSPKKLGHQIKHVEIHVATRNL
jgi:hypothetical protein